MLDTELHTTLRAMVHLILRSAVPEGANVRIGIVVLIDLYHIFNL